VVQVIDDVSGRTIVTASDRDVAAVTAETQRKVAVARAVGKLIAERARAKGVTAAIFDRGGYAYHGRVQAVAEGAREGGLAF
jgi:large subunit ribosomal protein L18